MTTNQEGVHAAVRNVTATAGTYLEDWHALFTANSVAAGPFNERMLSFLNTNLGTSYARLTDAMNAFAISQGFSGWNDMNTFTLSEAAAMLAAESQGLALVFTDDAFYGRDGFYGSAEIKDTGTPANNYSASPVKAASSLLTYTSPSPKLTLGPDGLYRYQAHNLYLNSAAPANQSITVVSGATYAVTITGSVSVTASGAATGTWTAGTNTFTAGTTTLTLGSTSGSGTVHVRRTPSDSTYLATTSAARYDLPFEWDSSGILQGIRVEEARTNLCLYSNDLRVTHAIAISGGSGSFQDGETVTATGGGSGTYISAYSTSASAVLRLGSGTFSGTLTGETSGATRTIDGATALWTATNCTVAKTATGPDGVANSASTLTATAGNATCLQAITSGSAARITSCFVKRRTGSGTIEMTQDNGSTWAAVTVTSGWTRVNIAAATLANPTVGLRIVTSGDAVDVAYFQQEVGAFVTSPIETFGSSVTRAADNISLATSAFPFSTTEGTFFANVVNRTTGTQNGAIHLGINTNEAFLMDSSSSGSRILYVRDDSTTQADLSPAGAIANAFNKQASAWAANDFAACINGGTVVTDKSGSLPTVTLVNIGRGSQSGYTNDCIAQVMILPVRKSDAELQALTGA